MAKSYISGFETGDISDFDKEDSDLDLVVPEFNRGRFKVKISIIDLLLRYSESAEAGDIYIGNENGALHFQRVDGYEWKLIVKRMQVNTDSITEIDDKSKGESHE